MTTKTQLATHNAAVALRPYLLEDVSEAFIKKLLSERFPGDGEDTERMDELQKKWEERKNITLGAHGPILTLHFPSRFDSLRAAIDAQRKATI